MNARRVWLIFFVVSLVLLFGSMALPESMGDTPTMIGGIGLVLAPVCLIGFIVCTIKAKRKPAPVVSQPQSIMPTPQPSTPAPKKAVISERVHVRGCDYYVNNIKAVAHDNPDYDLTKRELIEQCLDEKVWQYTFDVKAALVPEPDNPDDPKAIMVQANGLCIGYVPKGSTGHIRKLMESGRIKSMDLDIGGGKYKEVYAVDEDENKYEMDRDENPYSAVLTLYLKDEQPNDQRAQDSERPVDVDKTSPTD